MASAPAVDFNDIQGLVVRGYGKLPAAEFLLLSIRDRHASLVWLRDLVGQVNYADSRPETQALNVALSHHGLQQLGIDEHILAGFSDEFRSGMTTPHKRHILGDEGDSAPENWLWGGPETPPVDVLLLCYGNSPSSLAKLTGELTQHLQDNGLSLIARLDTEALSEFKEHFGFRDGIAQPYIAEFDKTQHTQDNPVPLGEILLGYPNGYERYTRRPLLEPEQDPHQLLVSDPEGSTLRDLGFNGTYLVFRQLFQDVPAFWRYMKSQAEASPSSEQCPITLASKMVGRWPSGAPLVLAPQQDNPELEDKDAFNYHATDPDGLKCPLGAHIRRTHPRDSLPPEPGSEKSMAFANRHRLLRRGRAYGKPFDRSMNPERFLANLDREAAPKARGLHFICLNANIGRQFEFVQHTWSNNANFNGLYHDSDPITGIRRFNGRMQDQFTIQQWPIRRKLKQLPTFVQTRGGGYFFLPSRRAMRFLFSE